MVNVEPVLVTVALVDIVIVPLLLEPFVTIEAILHRFLLYA